MKIRAVSGAFFALVLCLMPVTAKADDIIVFAAASLKGPLDAAARSWSSTSGQKVTLSYAASSTLMRQIEQGAPADIIASADPDWMRYGEERHLIRAQSTVNLLGNTLVLIEPAGAHSTIELRPGADLAGALGDSLIAVAETRTVPAGRYARSALEKLGLFRAVESRLAMADNVRSAMAMVARREVAFGIVYATDAQAEPGVRVVAAFPADSHAPIIYSFSLTTASSHKSAPAFLAFLQTPAGMKPFIDAGFKPLLPHR